MIIYNFLKSDAKDSNKNYIAKIFRNIDNWSQAYILEKLKTPIYK